MTLFLIIFNIIIYLSDIVSLTPLEKDIIYLRERVPWSSCAAPSVLCLRIPYTAEIYTSWSRGIGDKSISWRTDPCWLFPCPFRCSRDIWPLWNRVRCENRCTWDRCRPRSTSHPCSLLWQLERTLYSSGSEFPQQKI